MDFKTPNLISTNLNPNRITSAMSDDGIASSIRGAIDGMANAVENNKKLHEQNQIKLNAQKRYDDLKLHYQDKSFEDDNVVAQYREDLKKVKEENDKDLKSATWQSKQEYNNLDTMLQTKHEEVSTYAETNIKKAEITKNIKLNVAQAGDFSTIASNDKEAYAVKYDKSGKPTIDFTDTHIDNLKSYTKTIIKNTEYGVGQDEAYETATNGVADIQTNRITNHLNDMFNEENPNLSSIKITVDNLGNKKIIEQEANVLIKKGVIDESQKDTYIRHKYASEIELKNTYEDKYKKQKILNTKLTKEKVGAPPEKVDAREFYARKYKGDSVGMTEKYVDSKFGKGTYKKTFTNQSDALKSGVIVEGRDLQKVLNGTKVAPDLINSNIINGFQKDLKDEGYIKATDRAITGLIGQSGMDGDTYKAYLTSLSHEINMPYDILLDVYKSKMTGSDISDSTKQKISDIQYNNRISNITEDDMAQSRKAIEEGADEQELLQNGYPAYYDNGEIPTETEDHWYSHSTRTRYKFDAKAALDNGYDTDELPIYQAIQDPHAQDLFNTILLDNVKERTGKIRITDSDITHDDIVRAQQRVFYVYKHKYDYSGVDIPVAKTYGGMK